MEEKYEVEESENSGLVACRIVRSTEKSSTRTETERIRCKT